MAPRIPHQLHTAKLCPLLHTFTMVLHSQVHLDMLPTSLQTLSLQNARVLNAHLAAPRMTKVDTVALYSVLDWPMDLNGGVDHIRFCTSLPTQM